MSMRCVLLAFAVLGVALILQGCGGPPDFVYDECASKLTYILANSTVDGVADAQSACKSTFVALTQQQLCVARQMTTIQRARSNLMQEPVRQCGEFVMAEVCSKNSECGGKAENLKPTTAFNAVASFFSHKSQSILDNYAQKLKENIQLITQQHYDEKFNSRLVPQIVRNQCTLTMETKVDDVRLTQPPVSAMTIGCNNQAATAGHVVGSAWYTACVSAGTEAIIAALSLWKKNFITQCTAGTLDAVCPKGSACAIETSTADPTALTTTANTWVLTKYDPAEAQALITLSNMATGWIFSGPSRLFEVNGFKVTTTHFATGGVYFAAGFTIIGLGAFFLARRRMQATREVRVMADIDDLAEELAVELE